MLKHSAAASGVASQALIPSFLPYQNSLVWYYDMGVSSLYNSGTSVAKDALSTDELAIVNGTYSSTYKGGITLNGTNAYLTGSSDTKYQFNGHANNWTLAMIVSTGTISTGNQFILDTQNGSGTNVGYRLQADDGSEAGYSVEGYMFDGSTVVETKFLNTVPMSSNKFYAITWSKYTNNSNIQYRSADGGTSTGGASTGAGVNMSTLTNNGIFTIGASWEPGTSTASNFTNMTVHAYMGWTTNIATMSGAASQTIAEWTQALADNYYSR